MNRLALIVATGLITTASIARSEAGILFRYDVQDPTHIMDGATFTTFAPGNFVWTQPAGYDSQVFSAAVNAPWTATISGATGLGSVWNGTYRFLDPGPLNARGPHPNVGLRYFSSGPGSIQGNSAFKNDGSSELDVAYWTNGSNSFAFGVRADDIPGVTAGTPVDLSGLNFFITTFGTSRRSAPPFGQPRAGVLTASTSTTSTSAVPEPRTYLFFAVTAGLVGLLNRRFRIPTDGWASL